MSDIEVEVFIFNNVTIIVYIIGSIEVEMYWYWHWSYGRYPRGVWSGHHRASYRFPASRDGIVDPSTEKQNETICFFVPRSEVLACYLHLCYHFVRTLLRVKHFAYKIMNL